MPPYRIIALPLTGPLHKLCFVTLRTTKLLAKHHPSLFPILSFKRAFPLLLIREVNLHRHLGFFTVSKIFDILRVLLADGERVSFGDVDCLAGETFEDGLVEDEDGRFVTEGKVADGVEFSEWRGSRIE